MNPTSEIIPTEKPVRLKDICECFTNEKYIALSEIIEINTRIKLAEINTSWKTFCGLKPTKIPCPIMIIVNRIITSLIEVILYEIIHANKAKILLR